MLSKTTLNFFVFFVLGIHMMFFPEFHNNGTKLNFGMPDTIYVGIFFTCVSGIILLIKLYIWYINRKEKKDEKHNDDISN